MHRYVRFVLIPLVMLAACTTTLKVQTGQQAYEVKQYSIASKLFEEEYDSNKDAQERANLAFLAGESYSYLNNYPAAATWYLKAAKEGYGDIAMAHYGDALKRQEKYEEALKVFEALSKSNPGNAAYRAEATLCRQAIEWSHHINLAYQVAPVSFNSAANDYSPQPIGPGQVIFTSDRGSKEDQILISGPEDLILTFLFQILILLLRK